MFCTLYTICSVGRAESCLPIWAEQRLHIGKVSIGAAPNSKSRPILSTRVVFLFGVTSIDLWFGIVSLQEAALQRCQEAGAGFTGSHTGEDSEGRVQTSFSEKTTAAAAQSCPNTRLPLNFLKPSLVLK